tara:strand:- start:139 stop:510 length:372 start_codon:yes stop_codon:yes gene_type:complete
MISLTENAAKEISTIMKNDGLNLEEVCVRIGVKAGGCSGFSYVMDFDDKKRRVDLFFESQGLGILVDKKSYLFIKDTVIDWAYDLTHHGVNFANPAAKGTCGCRISFMHDGPEQTENVFTPTW